MKDYSAQSRSAYDKKADAYDDTFDGRFTEGFKLFLLEKMIFHDNDLVLDVACGNGSLLGKMSKLKKIRGFGIDISEQMIKNAALRNAGMRFQAAGCESIPLGDNEADVITVCAAYHHFPDVNAFAKEAARVAKQGGRLYIAEVYLPAVFRAVLNPFMRLSRDGDVKFYSPEEIRRTFAACGFECRNVYRKGHIQIIHLEKMPG